MFILNYFLFDTLQNKSQLSNNLLLKYYRNHHYTRVKNKITNKITNQITKCTDIIYNYIICPITFCSLCKIKEMNLYNQTQYYYYDYTLKNIQIMKVT
jgi:hypothetical protein